MAASVLTGSNFPFNSRIIVDTNFIVSASFPNTNQPGGLTASLSTSGSTPSLNFVQATPYPTTEKIILQVNTSNLIGTSGSLPVYFWLQNSNDNVTFTNIVQLAPVRVTDSAGTGSASTTQYLLPPNVFQYVRLLASSSVGGMSASGITGSYTASVLF